MLLYILVDRRWSMDDGSTVCLIMSYEFSSLIFDFSPYGRRPSVQLSSFNFQLSTINHQPSSIIKSVLDKRIPGIVLGKTVPMGGCTHELDDGGMYARIGSGRVVR